MNCISVGKLSIYIVKEEKKKGKIKVSMCLNRPLFLLVSLSLSLSFPP